MKKFVSLNRSHKTAIHMVVIAAIALSLIHEGNVRTTDWLFVGLSVLCETA